MPIAGLALVTLNGIYELEVTDAIWDLPRTITPRIVQSGEILLPMPKGVPTFGFNEVVNVSPNAQTNFMALSNFVVSILDFRTKVKLFAGSGFEWNHLGGSTDLASAATKRKFSAIGRHVTNI